ncbi:MAG: efflux RND transporter periplasmic adaptor subunit [Myxococcales bacterium]|nr:efflux RND transporter periplasmic adaptor subunit [Myxococcales bacterium]
MIKLLKEWRSVGAGVVFTAVILIGALLIQHFRHSWPFSPQQNRSTLLKGAAGPDAGDAGTRLAANARAEVDFDPARLEVLGVRAETATLENISNSVRAMATVVPDESRVSHVHTRVAGWIERLSIDPPGQAVRAGQPLAGIFSQELLSSQSEFLAALRSAAANPQSTLLEGARARLKVFGMSDAQIRSLEKSGQPQRLVTVAAPRRGVVLHRGVSVGTAVDPSTEIMTIADLSRVWVFAEVPEADVPQIAVGTRAVLEFSSSGLPPFEAHVEFLYPTLTERTRTLRVRFAIDNPKGSLRPGIYGTADFQVTPRQAVTVGRDAVVDTGIAQHVFVVASSGRFVPRTVKLGARLEDRIEIREGLEAGEKVVASGVFLIDSESRLRASGGGTGGHAGHTGISGAAKSSPAKPDASDAHKGHETNP